MPGFKLALISLHGDKLWGDSLHYYNPLALTTLAGYLEKSFGVDKIEIKLFDTLLQDYKEVAEKLNKFNPDLAGFSVKTNSLFELRTIMDEISSYDKLKDLKIVLGGIAPTIIYKDLLKEFPSTYIIRGEGEVPLVKLIKYLRGKTDIKDIPNLVYKDDSHNILQNQSHYFELGELYFQPTDEFTDEINNGNGDFWIESSRGCRGNCSFCSKSVAHFGSKGHRRFPLLRTTQRIKDINKKFGITNFRFGDEDFINEDFGFIQKFCEEVLKFDFPFTFEIDATVRGIFNNNDNDERKIRRKELWNNLQKAGLRHVFIGLESLSNSQLKRYNKCITVKGIIKALSHFPISYAAGFIPFDPFVTIEELKENFINLKNTGIIDNINTPIKFMRIQIGTALAERTEKAGLITGKSDNRMCYTYEFSDKNVSKVCKIILRYSHIFKTYAYKINYLIRPTNCDSITKNPELLEYFSESNLKFKRLELDYLIDLVKNHRDEKMLAEREKKFLRDAKNLYIDIQNKSNEIEDPEKKEKIYKVCRNLIKNI